MYQDDQLLFLWVIGDSERSHSLLKVFVCRFLGAPVKTESQKFISWEFMTINNSVIRGISVKILHTLHIHHRFVPDKKYVVFSEQNTNIIAITYKMIISIILLQVLKVTCTGNIQLVSHCFHNNSYTTVSPLTPTGLGRSLPTLKLLSDLHWTPIISWHSPDWLYEKANVKTLPCWCAVHKNMRFRKYN